MERPRLLQIREVKKVEGYLNGSLSKYACSNAIATSYSTTQILFRRQTRSSSKIEKKYDCSQQVDKSDINLT